MDHESLSILDLCKAKQHPYGIAFKMRSVPCEGVRIKFIFDDILFGIDINLTKKYCPDLFKRANQMESVISHRRKISNRRLNAMVPAAAHYQKDINPKYKYMWEISYSLINFLEKILNKNSQLTDEELIIEACYFINS
jgi:hypothetical protein